MIFPSRLAHRTGPHASTLHYIDNSASFPKEPALLLLDAGAEFDGYAADITRTIPVGNGGRFTEDAAAIYDIVLRMQDESLAMIKAGVDWRAVHLRAHQVAARGLLDLDILHAGPSSAQGDALIDELVAKGATLWAHGLGCAQPAMDFAEPADTCSVSTYTMSAVCPTADRPTRSTATSACSASSRSAGS